ncbi:hypothetical protein [Mucilaginibacter gotjawali]|uniref:Uncharacterized protein n=2 Tax=Mucilaginibacter gotjawali TaxID=1550579 RepID=A0A0X8X1S2_9SPHI|nr:hypothetical protein [Mucilaginibacter gotjawali]MBB3053946.1 hypothetical protein [Mucilaginibacter gotjawali]BAU54210.1 hypothetical protein MgSA37_02384 [Mucilaginibacter gotjawali]
MSGKLKNNRLNYIHDAVSSSGYNLDLRNQTNTTNYRYDVLGNLIYDAYSGITGNGGVNSITWSVYNKPLKIYKAGPRYRKQFFRCRKPPGLWPACYVATLRAKHAINSR